MNETSKPDYYGIGKVRSSLFHFLFGKGFSAIASLVVVVMIIRELAVAEYAIYATLHALVMFSRMLTSFGVNSAVLRFLPDLRVVGNNAAAYAMLALGVGLRALFYIVPIALVFLLAADFLSGALNLADWSWILG